MIGCLFRWAIRISFGIIAVLGAATAAMFILDPDGTVLSIAVILQPIVGNTRPPPIAQDQLAGMDWRTEKEASKRLTTLLHQRFPAGSSEVELRSTLLSQGFKQPPPPRPDCVPPGQTGPIGMSMTHCPTYDRSKVLEYSWGNVACSQSISVLWSTGGSETINGVDARYHMGCL